MSRENHQECSIFRPRKSVLIDSVLAYASVKIDIRNNIKRYSLLSRPNAQQSPAITVKQNTG